MQQKQLTILLNVALFVVALLIGYTLTVYSDHNKPVRILAPAATSSEPGEAVADFSFTTLDGKKHSLNEFKGKIVLINFWATWCAPCIHEFPSLLTLSRRNEKNVVLIALSSDKDDDTINKFLHKMPPVSANVFIARDTADITLKNFNVSQLPETIVTDRQLNKNQKLVGAEWNYDDLQKNIDSLAQ